jgi:hypothetical protein
MDTLVNNVAHDPPISPKLDDIVQILDLTGFNSHIGGQDCSSIGTARCVFTRPGQASKKMTAKGFQKSGYAGKAPIRFARISGTSILIDQQ